MNLKKIKDSKSADEALRIAESIVDTLESGDKLKVESDPENGIAQSFEYVEADDNHNSDYFLCSDGAEFPVPDFGFTPNQKEDAIFWVQEHNVG